MGGESRRGSDSSDERQSDNGDEDSDSQSSLGDGANADEVLIKQLKDEIISRDKEIIHLKQEITTLSEQLEDRDRELISLRGGGSGFGFSGAEGERGRSR